MASLSDVRVKRKISCQYNVNVWLSIISGHGANPIFFNKKIKIGRLEHSLAPHSPSTSDNISFLPYPPPCPPQIGPHMCITTN